MSVKDFPLRPPLDSPDYPLWLDALRRRVCIDDLLALASPALGDKVALFDISADATRGVTLSDIKALIVTGGITLGIPIATTSGTTWDFTGIPSGVKGAAVLVNELSTNGTSNLLIQAGDSGGFETTGYRGNASRGATHVASTAGFIATVVMAAANTYSGIITLRLQNTSAFSWLCEGLISDSLPACNLSAGSKSLSAELTQVRVTTVSGNTGDAGEVALMYWS